MVNKSFPRFLMSVYSCLLPRPYKGIITAKHCLPPNGCPLPKDRPEPKDPPPLPFTPTVNILAPGRSL